MSEPEGRSRPATALMMIAAFLIADDLKPALTCGNVVRWGPTTKCSPRRATGRGAGRHPKEVPTMDERTCSVDGCEKAEKARGWCGMHYQRWQRIGEPGEPESKRPRLVRGPLAVRLEAKLEAMPSGCIEFTGFRSPGGYGYIGNEPGCLPSHVVASRAAWEIAHGPIPEGLFVCHHCDNPPCCNLEHLFLGTHEENMADMIRKGRSAPEVLTCPAGHLVEGDNAILRIRRNGRFSRQCRECQRETNRRSGRERRARARAERLRGES